CSTASPRTSTSSGLFAPGPVVVAPARTWTLVPRGHAEPHYAEYYECGDKPQVDTPELPREEAILLDKPDPVDLRDSPHCHKGPDDAALPPRQTGVTCVMHSLPCRTHTVHDGHGAVPRPHVDRFISPTPCRLSCPSVAGPVVSVCHVRRTHRSAAKLHS